MAEGWVDRWWLPEQRERMYAKPTGNGWSDGHPHQRNENGWCRTCAAPPGCSHSRCVPDETTKENR